MGDMCSTSLDEDVNDHVILRCVKPQMKQAILDEETKKELKDALYEEDLHTSYRLLISCSPVFAKLLAKQGKHNRVIIVDKFCREDMQLFLRFASVHAFPIETNSKPELAFEINANRGLVEKVLPITYFYTCDALWGKLIDWITSHPELELCVQAEELNKGPVEWEERVLSSVLDEILTQPTASEDIQVKKGRFQHEDRK